MIPTKTIQLDFWRHPTDILHLVQGEADGRKVEFKILDNGSAFDLTGYTVQMAVKKPDGNIVVNAGSITDAANGVCEVTITSQVVAVVGSLHAELQILKEGQLSKSFRIVTKVAAGVNTEGIAPSVTEFGVLTDLITDVNTVLAIADTDLWPEVVANAQYFSDLAGAGRTTETVKGNADDIADLAGAGRNTETVKGNADEIADLAGTGRTTETVKGNADYISDLTDDLADLAGTGRTTETVKANADDIANRARTLNNGAEQTLTDKNKYYPLLSNVVGQLMGMHQTNVWNGSAWEASNNYGFGSSTLLNNTGVHSNGFGQATLLNNTGMRSNGFGFSALMNNAGTRANGFGAYALSNNIGGFSNGFGEYALSSNIGARANGFGAFAMSNNIGGSSNGFGAYALNYNQSPNNTAIGDGAYAAFLTNAAGAKTCADTDINITDDRATITAHGFGADNAVVILRYTATTGTAIGGLPLNTIFQAKVIDADTIEFWNGSTKLNLTSQGTGTHTFTPQFAYENTTCLGASTVPNKSNQVVLGNTDVDTVKMGGTARTPASATATGVKGEMCWDANYVYVCVATNTWKRSALSTW